jgi:DNA replication protein DnaC
MSEDKTTGEPKKIQSDLEAYLKLLSLSFMQNNFEPLADQAARREWSHVDYLAALAQGEAALRRDRSIERKIRLARFPVIKTLEQFRWSWPTLINRAAVQNLFRLKFIEEKSNVIFLGGVGLGKTHLATAIGYEACLVGKSVLFTSAIDVINTLSAAQAARYLKTELKKYLSPSVVILDLC